MQVEEVKHPLVQCSLGQMRCCATETAEFRRHSRIVTDYLINLATQSFETSSRTIVTPMGRTEALVSNVKVMAVMILRAGLAFFPSIIDQLPHAQHGYIWLKRDDATLRPIFLGENIPAISPDEEVLILDPMLATGGSAEATTDSVKKKGARRITVVSVISAPEGIGWLEKTHPDIRKIVTASVDDGLNEVGYIIPGLGDYGDRYLGTT